MVPVSIYVCYQHIIATRYACMLQLSIVEAGAMGSWLKDSIMLATMGESGDSMAAPSCW